MAKKKAATAAAAADPQQSAEQNAQPQSAEQQPDPEPPASEPAKPAPEKKAKVEKVTVRMKVAIAGHRCDHWDLGDKHGFSFVPQQEVELHPDLAKAWIESGHAEPVKKK